MGWESFGVVGFDTWTRSSRSYEDTAFAVFL